jgi:hypothetical protein
VSTELYDVSKVLPSLLADTEVMNGAGAIVFTKADGTQSKLFLRQGKIYAVDSLTYEKNLWLQLKFEERLAHNNLRSLIRSNSSQRDSLYRLLKKARTKNEEAVLISIKEYILGAVDDIFQWSKVRVEWRLGEEFNYDSADIEDLPLSKFITLISNRATYKQSHYEEWGFKNDEQFFNGTVAIDFLTSNNSSYEPQSKLEEVFMGAKKCIIKNVREATGYSLYSIISTIDDLKKNYDIFVENPAGFQKPAPVDLPAGTTIIRGGLHFSDIDEDVDVNRTFNNEYEVPEAAKLETQETFGDAPQKNKAASKSEEHNDLFDEILTDTTSLEVPEDKLPPLAARRSLAGMPARQRIPASEIEKEKNAQSDIEALYVENSPSQEEEDNDEESDQESPESGDVSEKETKDMTVPTNPTKQHPDIFELVKQLQDTLSSKKTAIDVADQNIKDKEAEIEATHKLVKALEEELATLVTERETAGVDYDKAVSVIGNIK